MSGNRTSSSPPAPAHSSPPISPTITHVSSRNPTPSPPESHDPLTVPLRSSSPPRSDSPHMQSSKPVSRPGESMDDELPPPAAHRPSMPPPSMSAPAGRLPRLLPNDRSSIVYKKLPEVLVTASSTSLTELAHLIRLQGNLEQRRNRSRVRLHRWLVATALSARLVHCGELAQRTMVDNFRTEDKRAFATLYNAFNDVRNSCAATQNYALLEPDLVLAKSKLAKAERANSFSNFMHEIPEKIRDDLLTFISEIRVNPDFLASRISALSTQELSSLTIFRRGMDATDSVIENQARAKGRPVPKSSSSQSPTPVERLLSFQRHDPLSALIYTIFANSSGPDSAEDLRRTDAWATTCARLIADMKPGSEKFVASVLDAWAGMREWPGKTNLELYLMKVLQDGHFLLDAEAQNTGQRSQIATPTAKETIASEEFFDSAVKNLFEVIDDEPSAGGIPEGVLEIGSAILKKMEQFGKKQSAMAQTFIVTRWFFSSYLSNAIIHPEYHGIMLGYQISDYARRRILREIASRAAKQAFEITYHWKQAVPSLPEIRTHFENIVARFKSSRAHSKPILLPAKDITSPRETVEVQPFVVLCPSDIVTLVNSLFPERRPSSGGVARDATQSGLASGASSISGVSIPFRSASTPGDGSSVLSFGASSMTSDTTSREPLLESSDSVNDPHSPLIPSDEHFQPSKVAPSEDYGRHLRLACSEMTRILGFDATAGSCHPCAEKWAVLFVSPDGKQLQCRIRKDADDDDDIDDDSPDSDSEDEGPATKMDLESEYHQLKESIAKLVEEYEIPKELAPESESKSLSNRAWNHMRESKLPGGSKSENVPTSEALSSRNPYMSQSQISNGIVNQRAPPSGKQRSRGNSSSDAKEFTKESPSVLITMLEAAVAQCQARSDFISAHLYYRTLQQLRNLASPSLKRNGYGPLLNYFSRGARDFLGKANSAIEEYQAWFVWLQQSQERHDANIEQMMLHFKNLRDKMWYIVDVRNSAGYEEARNVAMALKSMDQPQKPVDGKPQPAQRARNFSRSSAHNFLLRSETQMLDLMAALPEHAGPNKLADEQSDLTLRWLTQYGIENFCKGEERIHRFCLEIDKCVNKLVGDGILDGPVLWSSELYKRDKEILDSGRQKGDLFLTGVGTLSIANDEEYATTTGSRSFAPRSSHGSLRSISARNPSQQSFESIRSNNRVVDIMDSQDYFGTSSPALAIDSAVTFWSPFQAQAQAQSPANSPTSTNSIRPGTGNSSRGTVMLKNSVTVTEDKKRFLLDLKQTLTGLLLSDLGTAVFGTGSETDAWFSGDLGDECIQRKEAADDRRRKRALARKKSMRSLKSASSRSDHRSNALETLGRSERSGPAAPVATLKNVGSDSQSAGEHSTSSSSDATHRSSGMSAAKRAGLLEFPYNVAFQRLLGRFATHPSPYVKLYALYELELLIIASLSSRSGHQSSHRETLPTVPQSPTLGAVPELSSRMAAIPTQQALNIEEAIANVTERRSLSMQTEQQANGRGSPMPRPSSVTGTRSPSRPPSTDMIVDVLQGLFRNAKVRPKSLFRDLQYIASFVPAQMLDKTACGKAFWDAGLAALGLKQDVCRVMVEIADDIVALNTQNRSAAAAAANQASSQPNGSAAAANSSSSSAAPAGQEDSLSKFTMADAAKMLIITAKEGDAVAERELAIFYLTHPELLPRTVLPLTRPKDVFKSELLQRDRKKEDPARSDPMTMCVAQHWMEMSKKGGDQLATKYLRARDEMERIP